MLKRSISWKGVPLAANKRPPSMHDVAKLAGVGLGTVSNALNYPEKVKPETLTKINKAIAKLGYIRNDAARQLKSGSSQSLGLITPDSSNPFFAQLAAGAEDLAYEAGFAMTLANSNGNPEREQRYLGIFEEQRLSGILLSPTSEDLTNAKRLTSKGIRTVIVDRSVDAKDYCSVALDDVSGGRIAVEHLLSIGRRKIAFVGGPLDIRQVKDRLSGAKAAVRKVSGAKLEVLKTTSQTVFGGRAVGEQILAMAKADRPDAIFAANDLIAVGLMQVFAFGNKIKVPGEIAMVGYDDIDFAEAAVVPLSSIRQPAEEIGASAMNLLLDEMNNPGGHRHRQVTFQPELVIRASSAN